MVNLNQQKGFDKMEKIDKRKHYVLVVDTETANTIQDGDSLDMSNVLVYDCGCGYQGQYLRNRKLCQP